MIIWASVLIPIIAFFIGRYLHNDKITTREAIGMSIASLIIVSASYFLIKSVTLSDVEYNSYVITKADYYESWETWRKRTCSRTTKVGKSTITTYYDCSYCDYTPDKYFVTDHGGNNFSISKDKWISLKKKWKATPVFKDLDRSINHHFGCGKDGDMYSIYWNKDIYSSESSNVEESFTNYVKGSHSAFRYDDISDELADSMGLYRYPEFYEKYKQKAILGLDSIKLTNADSIQTKFEYLNGFLGKKKQVKVFTLIFKNKPQDIAFKQEQYWEGGNQNEIVICIGVDSKNKPQWTKCFSWCDNKRITVDMREDIMQIGSLDFDKMYNIYIKNINRFYRFKSFEDFNYLLFEPTTKQIILVYLLVTLITILGLFGAYKYEM